MTNKIILKIATIISFTFSLASAFGTQSNVSTLQQTLSENVIRLHILANSNSTYDQEVKLLVRDSVLAEYTDILNSSTSISESIEILRTHQQDIENLARKYHPTAKVVLENTFFPTVRYGSVYFPQGEYLALKIILGDGVGDNWFCVLFPPICFVDIATGETSPEFNQELNLFLSPDEYAELTNPTQDFEVRFRIVEFFRTRQDEHTVLVDFTSFN